MRVINDVVSGEPSAVCSTQGGRRAVDWWHHYNQYTTRPFVFLPREACRRIPKGELCSGASVERKEGCKSKVIRRRKEIAKRATDASSGLMPVSSSLTSVASPLPPPPSANNSVASGAIPPSLWFL